MQLSVSGQSVSGHTELEILVKDCIANSRAAQKKLYERYSPAAYGVIKRYLYQDDGAAQEILNDAFFKIFTKLGQYSFQGAFEGWIRRIVINTITDHLRKTVKEDSVYKELQPDDAATDSIPVENMSFKELLGVVQTLPAMQRAVFNLFVFEDLPHKEISKELGLSENNSRWYLNDARKRLKEKVNLLMSNK